MLIYGGIAMGLQQTLKALGDPTRREILNLLKSGTKSAGEISDHFDITAAAISRHLSVLKEADLIEDTREGKSIKCCIRNYESIWTKICIGFR